MEYLNEITSCHSYLTDWNVFLQLEVHQLWSGGNVVVTEGVKGIYVAFKYSSTLKNPSMTLFVSFNIK